jgi:hypothetical protein
MTTHPSHRWHHRATGQHCSHRTRSGCLFLLVSAVVLAWAGCRKTTPSTKQVTSAASNVGISASVSASWSTSSPTVPHAPSASTAVPLFKVPMTSTSQAIAALEQGTWERSVFRQALVGRIPQIPVRLTWAMFRTPTRARLQVFCQQAEHWYVNSEDPTPSGIENDESIWSKHHFSSYVGKRSGDKSAIYDFVLEKTPKSDSLCDNFPPKLRLTCSNKRVSVFPTSAEHFPHRHETDNKFVPVWKPSTQESVAVWQCQWADPEKEDVLKRFTKQYSTFPGLNFTERRTKAPGIEWIFEDDGRSDPPTGGGFRWMPQLP